MGEYEQRQRSEGAKEYFRFLKPQTAGYPAMLELFSQRIDALPVPEDARVTKIPTGEDVESLSAMLLDDDYYALLMSSIRKSEGVAVATPEVLIPFKAHSYLDLLARKKSGEQIQSSTVNKHRADVFRLLQLLDPTATYSLPPVVAARVAHFAEQVVAEGYDPKVIDTAHPTLQLAISRLRKCYGLPQA